MTIDFETPKPILQMQVMLQTVAENMMRTTTRDMDENEHAIPWDYIEFMHTAMRSMGGGGGLANPARKASPSRGRADSLRIGADFVLFYT